MSLSAEFLDELRARTPMSALVGKSVRLRKAGNEWQACCPFHNEKSASFYVNDDKAFAHCFGCGWNGDAIKWVQEHRGLEFLDAVRELADAAGMQMPVRDSAQQDREQRNAGAHAITGRAAEWFARNLDQIAGAEARAYLERRGVRPDIARSFMLGFAPDSRTRLRQELADIGDRSLIEVGLLAAPEDGREPYDRFRGRLMFPIRDPRGRIISFGGRIMGQGEPKYLNGPETPIFDKGRTLFNLDRAGPIARKSGRIVVVEGYMDVIGLAQVGLEEVVAPLGTALTEHQIGLLWRVVPTPILCFDGDAAGQRASAKAAIRALPGLQPGRSLAFAMLPAGQDPDDIARAGGRRAIDDLIGAAIPMVDLIWRHEYAAGPTKTPEDRAALRQRLVDHARTIADRDLAREYEQDFRRRVDSLFQRRGERKPAPQPINHSGVDPMLSIRRKMITAVIRGLARHPKTASMLAEQAATLSGLDQAQKAAMDVILDAIFGGTPPDPASINEMLPAANRGYQGFVLTFLKRDMPEAIATAELEHTLTMLVAIQEGLPLDDLVQLQREYKPLILPDAGKLL